MELRALGKSGLQASCLSLGTMTLGEADKSSMFYGIGCSKEDSFKIIDLAVERGVNLIDTANIYGTDGVVEKLLGDYFQARTNRQNLILATKFRFSMGENIFEKGASRKHIMSAVEGSLKRLKTDYIDLYQIHMQDLNTPEEETIRALDDLVRQGKIRYFGASNYAAYRFLSALHISEKLLLNHYCSLQMQYSLLCRDIELEHIPLCRSNNVGLLVWSPLAGGFLSGKYDPNKIPEKARFAVHPQWGSRFMTESSFKILKVVKEVAESLNASPSQVSLAWLLKKPQVSSVIIGARSTEQLLDNLDSASLELGTENMKKLDEISELPQNYPYSFIKDKQGRW